MTLTSVSIIALDNPASEKLTVDELFSERLSEAIRCSKKSGKEVAASAGIDAGYLSNLKGGKRPMPSVPVVKALSDALGVRADWLATGDPPMFSGETVKEPTVQYGLARAEMPQSILNRELSEAGTPLSVLSELRSEIIRCIQTGDPPPPRLLPLIGEIEAIVIKVGTKRKG